MVTNARTTRPAKAPTKKELAAAEAAAKLEATKKMRQSNVGFLLGLNKTMCETAKAMGQAEKLPMKMRIATMQKLTNDQERANQILLSWARDFVEGRI